ncbi:hypothetical protein ACJX0J_010157, partial [Zea mays]
PQNICIELMPCNGILDYMVTGFHSTLPSIETLTLRCAQWKRTILPGNPFVFTHLRHLKLELILPGKKKIKTDVLDYDSSSAPARPSQVGAGSLVDQVELALHILRSSIILEKLEIS